MQNKAIEHLKQADPILSKVINHIGPLTIISQKNSFYFLIREIVGQMISASVKKVIFERLIKLCDNEITPSKIILLEKDDLRNIGLSYAKSEYILNFAKQVNDGNISFEELNNLSDQDVIKTLTSIKGIGTWTAKMYLIFFLQRENVLPFEDGAFLQSYKWLYQTSKVDRKSIEKQCKKWEPYSSIGARYLYIALDSGLTKISPSLL